MFTRILKCASSLLIAACLGLTGACGGEEGDEPMIEPGIGENGGKADETGKDVRAYACEVFIDKVAAYHGSHAIHYITLYVKTLNDKLDGELEEVGFYGRAAKQCPENATQENCPGLINWGPFPGKPHFGAKDYFEIKLMVANDLITTRIFEGAVYARTSSGKTYWANPAGGGNFIVDFPMVKNVLALAPKYIYDPNDPLLRISTADSFEYLNPDHCK